MALDSLTAKANVGAGTDTLAGQSTASGFAGAVVGTNGIDEIERVIVSEAKNPRPKTRKIKREVIDQVLTLTGSGLLANKPVPVAVYNTVSKALDSPYDPAVMLAVQAVIERMVSDYAREQEDDEEEAILLLMAA